MGKLTRKESESIRARIKSITDGYRGSEKIREEFFAKPKISELRIWFDRAPMVQLTPEELEVVRKKATWEIIKTVIRHQRNVVKSSDDLIKWYETLKPINRSYLWTTMMMENRVDKKYRISIVKEMLNYGNPNYQRDIIQIMDRGIMNSDENFWHTILGLVVDYINNDQPSKDTILGYWAETNSLDIVTNIKGFESEALYELTGKEHYLPQAAKDLFLF